MRVKPTRDNLIVEIDNREQTLPSGIVVGIAQIERPWVLFGTAVAVGPGVRDVKAGDRVALKKDACRANLTEPGGPETLLVWERQIEGVIENE